MINLLESALVRPGHFLRGNSDDGDDLELPNNEEQCGVIEIDLSSIGHHVVISLDYSDEGSKFGGDGVVGLGLSLGHKNLMEQ